MIKIILRKPFLLLMNSRGGITLYGEDILLQSEFVSEFFKMCRAEGIHKTPVTAGYGFGEYDEILKYTDLVLLDIKHLEEDAHKDLAGRGRHGFLEFLDAVKKNNTKPRIRHVVVSGITNDKDHIRRLAEYINTIPKVEKVELLPYHVHGVNKYHELNIKYRLGGVAPLELDRLNYLYGVLNDALRINGNKTLRRLETSKEWTKGSTSNEWLKQRWAQFLN